MDTSVRVLCVDDEPTFGEVVAEYLEQEDDRIEVLTELSPSAGLARLEDDDPTFDCVVSDYDMPEMNGIEFLEAVRNKRPDLPFILFTGKGSEEIARDAFAAGATDYLQKSSGTDQYTVLAKRILNAYDGYRAERELREMTDLYETTLNNMSDTVLITDDDGSFTYVCPNVEAIFGYSSEEVTDSETIDALLEERLFDRSELEAKGEISNIETEITNKSGDRRTVLVSVKQVSIQDGTRLYTVRDITDRKEREHELRQYARMVNTMQEAACIYTEDARFDVVNQYLAEFYESTREELEGKRVTSSP